MTINPYSVVKKTDTDITLEGYHIDNFQKIIDTCIAAHSRLPMYDLIGWDIAVDENQDVVIIEFNPNPDMRLDQLFFGNSCLLDSQKEIVSHVYGMK